MRPLGIAPILVFNSMITFKNVVDALVLQIGAQFASQPLGFGALVIAHRMQQVDHFIHAGCQRARHVGAQDQQIGDPLGRDRIAVDLAVHLEG